MPNGYGQIHYKGKTAYAHRIAYELKHGPIGSAYVCHTCDNRKCMNTDHMFLGTDLDNIDDMVQKKRHSHSQRNGHAKLTNEQARAIREEAGLHKEIAKRYGVSQATVTMIKNGKTWRHV